jgi:hypothetical protein
MLKVALSGKDYQFYTFTEILGFIQNLHSDRTKEHIAEQAIKLLKASNLEHDLIEYYTEQFNSYITKKEENESQEMVLPNWYSRLSGFYL